MLFLLLFPSIFIFSSTIGKDGIVFCGLSLIFYSINKKSKIKYLVKDSNFLIGILLLIMIRAWISYIIILCLFFYIFAYFIKKMSLIFTLLSLTLLMICTLFFLNNLELIKLIIESSTKFEVDTNKFYGFMNIFINFQNNFIIPERLGNYGNFINSFTTFYEFLILPKGFFATLFRPMFLIDNDSLMIVVAGIQNFVLLTLFFKYFLKNNILLIKVLNIENVFFQLRI